MNSKRTYLILTLTAVLGLLLPGLVQDGMFLDGVTYAAISKNLANGVGSCWNPHYTQTLYPSFHEHPPLVFMLQSLFFRLFGDGFLTERIYTLFTALLTVAGIILCWRIIFNDPQTKQLAWVPVMIWLSVPVVTWSYANNLLENTLGVFTLFSVFFILKAMKEKRQILLLPASLLIIAALLSKGLVGLFPLVTPLAFSILHNSGKILKPFFILAGYSLILIIGLMMAFPGLQENLMQYFDQQLIPALSNEREISAGYRLKIVVDMILELGIPLIIIAFMTFRQFRKHESLKPFADRGFLLFLIIALCASVPLIISLKQRRFYLIPSIPFYALSFGFILIQFCQRVELKIPARIHRVIRMSSFVVLAAILMVSAIRFGRPGRDSQKLEAAYTLAEQFPAGAVFTAEREVWSDWELTAYLSRVGRLSLDCDKQHAYFLADRRSHTAIPEGYVPAGVVLEGYLLFRKVNDSGE
jgi:4-amino-4-deoxy-L-arabinose transferase-like glycosyltransferase